MTAFSVITADPPWQFADTLPGKTRGAVKNYVTMSDKEIIEYSKHALYPEITRDAALFIWRVSSQPQLALDVIKAWGFHVKTELIWVKTKNNVDAPDSAKDLSFGMGHTLRGAHETCHVATRGRPQVKNHSTRTVFFAPRGLHSEKPEAFFKIVEDLFDGPYVELFARKSRKGWSSIGNEIDNVQIERVVHS